MLRIHVLRDQRLLESVSVEALPFGIGSRKGSDLLLDDPGIHAVEARVVLGPDGVPELHRRLGGDPVALRAGVHVELGPFVLAFGAPRDGDEEKKEGETLARLLELLPRLWDEEADRPDFPALLAGLLEILGASWGAFVAGGDQEATPRILCQAGRRPGGEVPLSRTVLARLAEAEAPVLLSPGSGEEASVGSIPLEVRSVMAAPLVRGGRQEGLVYLESPREQRSFTPAARDVLVALCDFAAGHLDRVEETRALRARRLRLEELYREEIAERHGVDEIIGSSPGMRAVIEQVKRAAPTEVTTLVIGESGTGKELVATALHRLSRRAHGPFVAVNCAALPAELVESELFGHRKGAFSSAVEDRLGRFQLAEGGTLFLDELGDLPMPAQAKLLRVLESRLVQPVGDAREYPVDVRVVAATHRDLSAAVAAGQFREDLFFRLSVFEIHIPPLRQHAEDLPELVEHLVTRLARRHGKTLLGVSSQALEILRGHAWPGNVRELGNVLEQAVVRASGEWIDAGCLGLRGAETAGEEAAEPDYAYPDELDTARALFERSHIARLMKDRQGDVAAVAERLGIARSNLYKRLKSYSLDPTDFR